MSHGNKTLKSTAPSIFSGSSTRESPDVLLNNFLRGTDIMAASEPGKTPQQLLKDILNDSRWTRRMAEDWYKQWTNVRQFKMTPHPEQRAIYLMLLSLLEDQGKEETGLREATEATKAEDWMKAIKSKSIRDKELDEKIEALRKEYEAKDKEDFEFL